MTSDPPRRPRPTFQDWLLLAINVVFVAMGLVILPSKPDVGVVTLAFFGSCLVVTAGSVWRKLRDRRFSADTVEVVGGVPIRPRVGLFSLAGLWMLALGTVLIVFGHAYPLLFRIIAGFIALVGAGLLVAVVVGVWPAGYLRFDPDALTIAERGWCAVIPWHEIAAVREGDYHTNPVLLIDVADVDGLAIEPPAARLRAMKKIAQNQSYLYADFAIMPTHYGIGLPALAAAVIRYATDATARAELKPRLA